MPKYSNIAYLDGSHTQAQTGLWPREHEIGQGTVLYRFVDLSKAPAMIAADGPWWLEFEHYQAIKHFALRHQYSLGYCARLFTAILYEWSEVNAVVRAEVTKGPLKVWKGRGKQVAAKRADRRDVAVQHGLVTELSPKTAPKMTPMQGNLEVYQLFIPGLGRPYQKFGSLMKLLGVERLRSD